MSPFIDDRGRLFGRLNILDILVLLLIVALAVFAFTRVRDSNSTSFKLRITLEIDKLSQPPVNAIKVGQTVRDDSGNVLGKVVSAPPPTWTLEEGFDASGFLRNDRSKIYKDVMIIVAGDAQGPESSPRIGSTPILRRNLVQAIGPGWSLKMQIMDFQAVKP